MKDIDNENNIFGVVLMPLIDVMMFVVIIFMVLYYKSHSPLLSDQISLPKVQQSAHNQVTAPLNLVIGVSRSGNIYIKGETYSFNELESKVLNGLDKQTLIYIQGDSLTPYESIVRVLSYLRQEGFEKIYLLSLKK